MFYLVSDKRETAHTTAAPAPQQQPDRLREVAQEFEAIFVEMILRQGRQATRALSDEKPSFARETYESWQDQQRARAIAGANGIGLAEILYRQLQQQSASTGK